MHLVGMRLKSCESASGEKQASFKAPTYSSLTQVFSLLPDYTCSQDCVGGYTLCWIYLFFMR